MPGGPGEAAVSSVVGTVLMLSITVTVFGALSLVVLQELERNEPPPAAELDLVVEGDRAYLLHRGGEDVPLTSGTVELNVGGYAVTFNLTAFADQVTDGLTWRIGDALCVSGPDPPVPDWTCLLEEREILGAILVSSNGLLLSEGERGAYSPCPLDDAAPTATWGKGPADLFTTSTGAVAVTLVAADDCLLNNTAVPTLSYRIDDGSSPAYTSLGAMTAASPGTWTATVPAQSWNLLGNQTLQLVATGVQDHNGNTQPLTHDDLVNVVTLLTNVTAATPTLGTVTDLSAAQTDGDGDGAATLAEAPTATSPLLADADGVNALRTSNRWSGTANVGADDGGYATTDDPARDLQATFASPGVSAGTITSVVLQADVSILGASAGDGFVLQACFNTSCGTASGTLEATSAESTISWDVTANRPGGGSWSWADLEALEGRISGVRAGSAGETWRVDLLRVQVGFTPAQALDVRLDFSGTADGASETLDLRYRATGDTFQVEVWDGAAYNVRGTLTSTSFSTFTYVLTAAEYNGGAPRIRLTDLAPTSTTQGTLELAHARVVTR